MITFVISDSDLNLLKVVLELLDNNVDIDSKQCDNSSETTNQRSYMRNENIQHSEVKHNGNG